MSDIAAYSELMQISQRMLVYARKGEWEELVALETIRAQRIAGLRAAENGQPDKLLAPEVLGLINGILSCDEEIRCLTEQWMGESKEILNSISAARKLQQTYR